jgi:large subunit ribosomal protein L19
MVTTRYQLAQRENFITGRDLTGIRSLKLQLVKSLNDPLAGCNFTYLAGNCSPARAGGKGIFVNQIIDAIEKEQHRGDVTPFSVGDSVRVHTRVVEGDKERVQIFSGIVIGRKGRGLNETFTVRRISYGEGVERVFPLHSPRIAKVEVEQQGRSRRARLNYLRTRKGKEATAVRE